MLPRIAANSSNDATFVNGFTSANFFNAPVTPWTAGAIPGWYYGADASNLDAVPWVVPWLRDPEFCSLLAATPGSLQCPAANPPANGWVQVFSGLTAAIQADDYMTFGLVDTVADCQTMCEGVDGCVFFNAYHDVNGKDGSPLLTCSLYSGCHTAAEATNTGGQTQPDGSVDFITDSEGWCFTSGPKPSNIPRALPQVPLCPVTEGFRSCPAPSNPDVLECINIMTDLESCGGCVSLGTFSSEGRDCTAIAHVDSVSCQKGSCVIEKCASGYKVAKSLQGDVCKRI